MLISLFTLFFGTPYSFKFQLHLGSTQYWQEQCQTDHFSQVCHQENSTREETGFLIQHGNKMSFLCLKPLFNVDPH